MKNEPKSILKLLDRESSLEDLESYKEKIRKAPKKEKKSKLVFFLFRLEQEWFALSASCIKAVNPTTQTHSLPHKSNEILLGITNVEGIFIPEIDLKNLLKIDLKTGSSVNKHLSILIQSNSQTFIFKTDEIQGIISIDEKQIEALPSNVALNKNIYTTGIFSLVEKKVNILSEELIFKRLHL